MKSILTSAAIILLAVALSVAGSFLTPQSPAQAQNPAEERPEKLSKLIDQYRAEVENRKADHERQREAHRDRLRAAQEHREHPHREDEELERDLDQQRHRIQNMHVAAEHLEQAGMHDLAHRIHREAEESEQLLLERLKQRRNMEHHRRHPDHELHAMLHQLHVEVKRLKQEVHQLREAVLDRSEKE